MTDSVRALRILFRPFGTLRWVGHQLFWGARSTADLSSFIRYTADVLLYHVLRVSNLPTANRERRIRLKGAVELTYRLNRGDIQGIREVWVDEVYRPFASFHPEVVIDLGANIGLTSVFLARRYGSSTVIAVEPSPENCRIAKLNFERNGVRGIVVEAAVGPRAGTACFQANAESNLGQIASDGDRVRVLSMADLLAKTPGGTVDLLKMDIEGAEAELLNGDVRWLGSVGAMVAEFHPTVVDYPSLVAVIIGAGFSYIPGGTLRASAADCFIRNTESSAPAEHQRSVAFSQSVTTPLAK